MASRKLNDGCFIFFVIPLLALMGNIIFYNRNDSNGERFGFGVIYLLSLAETVVMWEANRLVIIYFRRKFPTVAQTKQRLIRIGIGCLLLTLVLRVLNIYLYDATMLWGYQFPLEGYLHSVFVALLFVIILAGIYEGIYYYSQWQKTAVEAEALKKENLQTRLDSLKTQINPHFLFNSLGTLSSLIEEDPAKAQHFVNDMSSVYRYLLQASENNLTTLQNELDFTKAYTQMLETRFAEGFCVSLNIDARFLTYQLPVLTLQVLIENAVKHNTILAHKPLHVEIYTGDNGELTVRNNLQKKTSPVISHHLGLNNISAKYKLLGQPDIHVEQTNEYFTVTVSLIK
jgi:two-component system LytT family sensor kinase